MIKYIVSFNVLFYRVSLFLCTCPASSVRVFAFFVKVSLVRDLGALPWLLWLIQLA